MKQWIIALLVCALLALSCPGLAEAVPAAMPSTGDVVEGFELIETRAYDLIGGEVYRFIHQKSGAELFYIANSDTNRFFQLAFRTQAIDNTGLPHVFEHATLDGSAKYPSKELWFNLANGSYNTYMNAVTDKNYTYFPIGSLSEAQLLKLADFYVDSCFHPMLMEDESIYREEAWRYRLDGPDDPLTIEGTVYSEMLGSQTLQRNALHNFLKLTLPGAYCCNDSGGVPEYIPDMTYESLTRYHDLYYHPSNSIAYLYGKFDDYAAFLRLLDREYSRYDAREIAIEDPGYTPITGPAEGSYDFPVEAGSDAVDASTVIYGVVCPGLKGDVETSLAFDLLTSLMNDSSSSLHRSIEKALPKASFGFGVMTDGPDPVFYSLFNNVNPEDAPALRALVDDGLKDIADNGFSQDMIDAVTASLEISTRLATESDNLGLTVMESLLDSYIASGDPWYDIKQTDALESIDRWNADGTFSGLVRTWLMDTDLTALTSTRPVPGLKEQNDAVLAEKLQAVKDAMSADEIDALVEAAHAEDPENPETAKLLAELTAVTVESLPEEVPDYSLTDETGEDGVRRVDVAANVDGIGIVQLLLDTTGIPQEDLQWMRTYINLIGELDTTEHDYQALDILTSRYMYGLSTSLIGMAEIGAHWPWLSVGWTTLDEDLETGYDLASEILFNTVYEDTDRLLEVVQGLRTSIKNSITSAPYATLLARGLSKTIPFYRLSNLSTGLGYYDFLGELETMLETQPQVAIEKLQAMQQYFFNNCGLIMGYVGSEAGIAANRPLADAFAASLDHREIAPVAYDLAPATDADSEALIVDSAIQFNGIAADLAGLGMADYDARIEVVNALIEDMYLYPQLRDRYGAYGVGLGASSNSNMYVYSYRDPNVAQTFRVYDALPDYLASLEVDQATVDRYILSKYTYYAMPTGELAGAKSKLTRHILGHETEEYLEWMRAIKSVTPESLSEFVDFYRAFVDKGYRFTGGGATAINQNAGLYDSILNPFGAVDRSQQDLSDVAEGSAYYEAARFAFENGFMDAREDGRFGVDEPAALGDLAAALSTILGESMDAPTAFETLTSYGILDGAASPEDALTAEDCEATLQNFTAAIGLEYPGGFVADAVPFTRGDLAQIIRDYVAWLDTLDATD